MTPQTKSMKRLPPSLLPDAISESAFGLYMIGAGSHGMTHGGEMSVKLVPQS